MKKKLIIAFIIFVIATAAAAAYLYLQKKQTSINNTQTPPSTQTQTAPQTTSATTTSTGHSGMKLYRNKEWGFEFWYPEGWEVVENSWKSPFSKFNLAVHVAGIYPNFEPFEINVTTKDFVDRSFMPLKDKAKQIIIDGVVGTRYEYIEETYYIDIIVSINDTRIIISNSNKEHLPEFNQILSTFKFLK